MKMKSLILGTILMLAATVAAQDECTRYKAIGGNAYAEKNYEKVTYAYVKALQECEVLEMKFLNPFIYSIKQAMGKAPDAAGKAAYLDTLLYVYEVAQKQHGMQADWQSYIGYSYLTQGKPDAMQKADAAYVIGIHHEGPKVNEGMLKQYYANLYNLWVQETDAAKKAEYKKRIITEYFKLSDYIVKGGMKAETSDFLTIYLDKAVTDCASLTPEINKFLSDLPRDVAPKIAMVNNFMTLLENKNCTTSPEYAMLVDTIIKFDPSIGATLSKAKLQIAQGKYSDAIKTYESALGLTTSDDEKSDVEMAIADAYFKSKNYRQAHNAGIKVSGKNSKRGFEIAAASVNALVNDCGVSTFERKANNYYAVELAEKSGNARLIAAYKGQTPSSSDIFNADKEVGESVTLECWGKTYKIVIY
jgi:tetratricopeptide (TPR) repeat protein